MKRQLTHHGKLTFRMAVIVLSDIIIFTIIQKKINMDIQSLKLDLVKKILNTERPSVLIKISKLFQTESTQDWWDLLPVEVQESILEGLKDAEEGNVFTHDQVMNEAREKYGF